MSQSDNQPQEIKKDAAIRSRSLEELFESESTVVRTNPEVSLTTEKGLDFGSGPISIKDMIARLGGIFPIDEAVREALPEGSSFISVSPFGKSAWTITGRLVALDLCGNEQYYFLKVAFGERGRIMLNGEYESSKLIHSLAPDFIPKPIGFGRYKNSSPATYFYMQEFVDMDIISAPDPAEWAERLAHMHKISKLPTGKFGFHTTTCDGRTAHTVEWEEEWSVFFRKLLLGVCKLEREANGPWPMFQRVTQQVADKVIPRLLGYLRTSEGGKVKPSLIHGDLHEGNMGIRKATGQVLLFDAGSYFAHNEMELGHWRSEFSSVFRNKVYREHYLEKYRAAEPAEEFDDRNRLYSLKGAINYAAGHPGSPLRTTL